MPAHWLRNRHAQTIYAAQSWAWRGWPELRREELRLPDGDDTSVLDGDGPVNGHRSVGRDDFSAVQKEVLSGQ